ncbi:hypothetical protein ACPFP2_24815 [Micromonospora citrea]|uniref:hypothetical protein n=1 Tax=Micromonospora citrea TaxID=47855 RepID=UPI003C5970BC
MNIRGRRGIGPFAFVAVLAMAVAGLWSIVPSASAETGQPAAAPAKPKVWVLSDLSIPGGGTDRDDIVTLAAMSTYADRFDIAKVVVGSTTVRIDCDAAVDYARDSFGAHLPNITLASTCADREGFTTCTAGNPWVDNPPATVRSLVTAIRAGKLTVLNWGPMTEIAAAVCHLEKKSPADLAKVRIISHWTDPSPGYDDKYNCNKDVSACDYLHQAAKRATDRIRLIEIGAAGQRFVDEANDACRADTDIPRTGLGEFLNVTKDTGTPDLSDGSTFLLMLTGGLKGYEKDGTDDVNFTKGFRQLCDNAPQIFDHLRASLT